MFSTSLVDFGGISSSGALLFRTDSSYCKWHANFQPTIFIENFLGFKFSFGTWFLLLQPLCYLDLTLKSVERFSFSLKQNWKRSINNPIRCVLGKKLHCGVWLLVMQHWVLQQSQKLKLTLKLYQREKLFHFLKRSFLQVSTSFHLLLFEEFILVAFWRCSRVWIKRDMRVNVSELKWQLSCKDVFTGVLGMWDVGYRGKEARSRN